MSSTSDSSLSTTPGGPPGASRMKSAITAAPSAVTCSNTCCCRPPCRHRQRAGTGRDVGAAQQPPQAVARTAPPESACSWQHGGRAGSGRTRRKVHCQPPLRLAVHRATRAGQPGPRLSQRHATPPLGMQGCGHPSSAGQRAAACRARRCGRSPAGHCTLACSTCGSRRRHPGSSSAASAPAPALPTARWPPTPGAAVGTACQSSAVRPPAQTCGALAARRASARQSWGSRQASGQPWTLPRSLRRPERKGCGDRWQVVHCQGGQGAPCVGLAEPAAAVPHPTPVLAPPAAAPPPAWSRLPAPAGAPG